LLVAQTKTARAGEIKALITIGMQSVIEELWPKFEKVSGRKLNITFGLGPVLAKRVLDGEAADFLILPRASVDGLIMSGKVASGFDTVLARTFVAIAVRKGEPKPDISTPDALRRTLLAAKAISYSDPADGGPTGIHFAKVLERLGIGEEMKAKTKFPPAGGFVGRLLVEGAVDIAVQQLSELMSVSGTEVVGPLPGDFQSVTVYVAAIPTSTKELNAAKALVSFLRSSEALAVMKARGVEPD
jgi:molybdate transport system substrate-binding protein